MSHVILLVFGYCLPHYRFGFCCRALTDCVVFWIFNLRSELIPHPPCTLVITVCFTVVSRNGHRPLQMELNPVFWVPPKTGHCTTSHENKSVFAEIRGLLKIHLNSSQAPLVAYSSISRGQGRHSYWLILSALAHFKWVTKSEAWHNAGCNISTLFLTVAQPFRVTNSSLWSHWGLG